MKKYWTITRSLYESGDDFICNPSPMAKSAFFYIQHIGHSVCSPSHFTKREGFRSILLIYTIKGKARLHYRDKVYSIKQGDMILLDCYDYHEYFADENDLWEIKWMHFFGATSKNIYNLIYQKLGAVIALEENSKILHHFDYLLENVQKGNTNFESGAMVTIVKMLTEILAHSSNGFKSPKSRIKQIDRGIDYIEKNYQKNISLKEIANHACLSPYHFSRSFKKTTGYSPYEYLIYFRINIAKLLLKTTDHPVEEIGTEIGFESTSNFIKTFKQLEEMTPLKYRKYWITSR
jgi:AraC-like DNA-binding protein